MKKITGIIITISLCLFISCNKITERETSYPNGQLKERWNIEKRSGKEVKTGLYESWHENGKRKEVFQYNEDLQHGVQKSFYSTGKIKRLEHYLFGVLSGKQIKWDKEENILSEVIFRDGKKNGKFLSYHKSGIIFKHLNYANDLKSGIQIEYDNQKNVVNVAWYKEGELQSGPADSAKIMEDIIKIDTTSTPVIKTVKNTELEEAVEE